MNLMDNCDDSSGSVGGAISNAIEKINDAAGAIPEDSKDDETIEEIFDMILNHATSEMYRGWTDWRMELMSAIIPLCGNRANRNKIEKFLSDEKNLRKEDWSRESDIKQFQKMQYEIIKQFDGESAAVSYMEQHLDNSDFKRTAIKIAIADGLYERALTLCLDGENKDSRSPGLVCEWKEYRYIVYKKTKNLSAQKMLGLDFVLNGNFDYFLRLKSLYSKEEWVSVLQNIVEVLENSKETGVYVKIIIHEKLKQKLLEYCYKYISSVNSYYTHLLPEYKKEVGALFIMYIRNRAQAANNRNGYRDVCDIIRNYIKACGKSAYAIRDELALKHARQPAFLDELRKIK